MSAPGIRQPQIDRHIGATIRRLRKTTGQTQAELAAACGLTYQQIQKYETGQNRVSVSRLWQIAQAQKAASILIYLPEPGGTA